MAYFCAIDQLYQKRTTALSTQNVKQINWNSTALGAVK